MIKFFCEGPAVYAGKEFVGRKGCGEDLTRFITAIPADNKEHSVECPKCKTVGTHRKISSMGGVARSIVFALLVLCPALGHAQTVLQVPLDSASIKWDPAPPASPPTCTSNCIGETRWYIMNCGAADIRIDMPATSVPVKTVAPAPGTYSCTMWAVNNFGRSGPATVPQFESGYIPSTPNNVLIEVR